MWGEREREGDAHKDKPRTENERFFTCLSTNTMWLPPKINRFLLHFSQPAHLRTCGRMNKQSLINSFIGEGELAH